MISEQDKRVIRSAFRKRERARIKYREANQHLIAALKLTRAASGATFSELGKAIGVSKQRIHQMFKEEE